MIKKEQPSEIVRKSEGWILYTDLEEKSICFKNAELLESLHFYEARFK